MELFHVLFHFHGAFVRVARGLSSFYEQLVVGRDCLPGALKDGFSDAFCEELGTNLGTDLGQNRSIAARRLLFSFSSGWVFP